MVLKLGSLSSILVAIFLASDWAFSEQAWKGFALAFGVFILGLLYGVGGFPVLGLEETDGLVI